MAPTYCVVTMAREDKHLGLVEEHLDGPLIPIDPRPEIGAGLTFEQNQDQDLVFYGDKLLNPRAVWWRESPGNIAVEGLPLDLFDDYLADHIRISVYRHAGGLLTLPGRFVSDPGAMELAHSKPLQLKAAKGLLHLPWTVQSSNRERAQAAMTAMIKRDGWCVRKITSGRTVYDPFTDEVKASPTQIITAANMHELDWDTLAFAPPIIQEGFLGDDITVGVVGTKVFPAKITTDGTQAGTGYLDFRQVGSIIPGKPHHTPCTISDEDAAGCIELTRRMGLLYSRLDFVRDASGQLRFLELNSTGNWAPLQLQAGYPVARSIAELMMAA